MKRSKLEWFGIIANLLAGVMFGIGAVVNCHLGLVLLSVWNFWQFAHDIFVSKKDDENQKR